MKKKDNSLIATDNHSLTIAKNDENLHLVPRLTHAIVKPMETRSNRQKLLLIITKSNFGGAQRYVYELATGLPKDRYEIIVALGGNGILKQKLEAAGIKIHEIKSLNRNVHLVNDLLVFKELLSLFHTEKPDIVHLNSSKIGGIGGVAGRLCGIKKIVFTGHAWAFNEDRNVFIRIIIGFFHWVTILLSTVTIIVSESTKKQIAILPGIKNKLRMIHNGIDTIPFISSAEAREKLQINPNNLVIGTISELHRNKGLDYLLSAFQKVIARHPTTQLVIIGEGEQRKNLETLIAKYQLENSVSLIGFIDDARIYLKAFDIFTLTSRTEALGYVLLEAGRAERGVVANAVGGIPEIITNKKSGLLVTPGSETELVAALETLITEPELRTEYARTLSTIVKNNFSLKQMIDKTQEVYKA